MQTKNDQLQGVRQEVRSREFLQMQMHKRQVIQLVLALKPMA
jgi:hypothetical protein